VQVSRRGRSSDALQRRRDVPISTQKGTGKSIAADLSSVFFVSAQKNRKQLDGSGGIVWGAASWLDLSVKAARRISRGATAAKRSSASRRKMAIFGDWVREGGLGAALPIIGRRTRSFGASSGSIRRGEVLSSGRGMLSRRSASRTFANRSTRSVGPRACRRTQARHARATSKRALHLGVSSSVAS
jgi:hypothetical protein